MSSREIELTEFAFSPIHSSDGEGATTCLHVSAFEGDIQKADLIIKNARNEGKLEEVVNKLDSEGRPALFTACFNNQLEVVKILLNDGNANVNLVGEQHNWTALHVAAAFSNANVVELLLKNGADIKAKNDKGRTPFLVACCYGNVMAMRVLWEHREQYLSMAEEVDNNMWTALHIASSHGRAETVEWLLTLGLPVNELDSDGRTALHRAASKGHLPVIKHLTALANIDLNVADREHNWTALHTACYNRRFDVAEHLILHHARTGVLDWKDRCPFDLTADREARNRLIQIRDDLLKSS